MAKKNKKNSKKTNMQLIEELVENCLLQVALLHIPEDFDDANPDEDDIQNVVNLALPATEEVFKSMLSSFACGYFGKKLEEEDEIVRAA